MTGLVARQRADLAPGAVHIPDWLGAERQAELVAACREWARPPAGMRHTLLPTGAVMSVQTVCLGWHWVPYRYGKTADDGAPVKPLPDWLAALGRQAVADAYGVDAAAFHGADYRADVALVNFYDDVARMGMHQDREEQSTAPVVSISLGAACMFRLGNTENRNRPWIDVRLESGDLLVFGGPARLAFHGVAKTFAGSCRSAIGLATGRLNITLRESGLSAPSSDQK
ncbi:MAG: alpha-ketoglutarate-dependent dioxygenase AlkB [Pseudonocardiales bacterium]|nr:MAG: alpha-ketoglutarate-dependent dioxygenase AlkB [Pseudonocardiales bacterium]